MIMDLVKVLNEQYMKKELPEMNVGDTVRVLVLVKEGNRERTQAFEGTSPSIVSVTTVRKGKVRRAKLYYLRDRVGKAAKVKERL